MAAIDLPASPKMAAARVRFLDWGADLTPSLGGPVQRISRLGSRHALDVAMPPMTMTDAMAWIQRLKRGKSDRVRMDLPLGGYANVGGDNISVSAAASSGTSISVSGGTASAGLVEGQWFSIYKVSEARHYLHSLNSAVTLSGTGAGTLTFEPMLRTSVSMSDNVYLTTPKIEGYLEGDETAWDIDTALIVGLSFSIVEAA